MTRVKQDRNRCQGNSRRAIGVNQADDDKRSDHGKHRHPDTATEQTDPGPHAAPQTEPTISVRVERLVHSATSVL